MNLKKYFTDIQYIIAGEGDELDNIKNKIKEYNLQDHVNLVGTVNENQKNYIFSNTDLMIMPTLDESSAKSIEGFGIAYIEAANFKIPSIASNIGGTPEAVIHNKTGLIIKDIDELDEAIKSLIDNKENTTNVTAKTIVAVLISSELLFSTLASTSLKSGALVFLIELLISSSNFSPESVCSAKNMKSSEKLSTSVFI